MRTIMKFSVVEKNCDPNHLDQDVSKRKYNKRQKYENRNLEVNYLPGLWNI